MVDRKATVTKNALDDKWIVFLPPGQGVHDEKGIKEKLKPKSAQQTVCIFIN